MNQKIKTFLGFAIKTGKVVFGLESLKRAKKWPILVMVDYTLGKSARKDVDGYCFTKDIQLYTFETETLAEITNRKNCKIVGIIHKDLGNVLIKEIACGGSSCE